MSRIGIAALSAALLLGVPPLGAAHAGIALPIGPEVVNGRPPGPGEFTFLAEIRAYISADQYYTCGGSFVSPTQVVTAAHCVAEEDGEEVIAVEAGSATGTQEPATFVTASRVQIHEHFSSRTGANDIALITLTRPLEDVATISIPNADEWAALMSAGAPVQSAGWGSTHSGGDKLDGLPCRRSLGRPRHGVRRCSGDLPDRSADLLRHWQRIRIRHDDLRRRSHLRGLPIDTCQGDSGGPLTARRGDQTFLVSIVSWGLGCAGVEDGEPIPLTPGVYTRLGAQLGWLALHGVAEPITTPGRVHGFSEGRMVGTSPRLRVTVSWKPPRNDGGSAVTHYRARYGSGGQWSRWKRVESTSLRLKGLQEGKRYRVQVRAANVAGAGPRTSYRLR